MAVDGFENAGIPQLNAMVTGFRHREVGIAQRNPRPQQDKRPDSLGNTEIIRGMMINGMAHCQLM